MLSRGHLVFALFLVMLLLVSHGCSTTQQDYAGSPELVDQSVVKLAPLVDFDNRLKLEVPKELMEEVYSSLDLKRDKLGYTADELRPIGNDAYLLTNVDSLFRDITLVPLYAGGQAKNLLVAQQSLGAASSTLFRGLGATGQREAGGPKAPSWGVKWLADMDPTQALEEVLKRSHQPELSASQREVWHALDLRVQRLVVLVLLAARRPSEWLASAYEELVDTLEDSEHDFDYLMAPFMKDEHAVHPEAFRAIGQVDMGYLCAGTTGYVGALDDAVREFKASLEDGPLTSSHFEPLTIQSAFGEILITDARDGQHDASAELIIDLGGNDTWNFDGSKIGDPKVGAIRTLIDCSGDDVYESSGRYGLGCGFLGVGVLYDLDGNDRYACEQAAYGCGIYGAGFLVDMQGDDHYTSGDGAFSQGSATVGVGGLFDFSGDDLYECGIFAQGYGGTRGYGVLVDVEGNDRYVASATAWISKGYKDRPLSFSQGAGFGRRADYGDGHCLAGGIGGLVDGSGDDSYYAHIWGQGVAYWWAFGFLEDLGGNDTYSAIQYSQAGTAHMGIASFVDLMGDDQYNQDRRSTGGVIGAARDASLSSFIDGSGNDRYYLGRGAAGQGNLNAIGMFWDRHGDDVYASRRVTKPILNSFGYATPLDVFFPSYRRDMPTAAYYLDTHGNDEYRYAQAAHGDRASPPISASNNATWTCDHGEVVKGVGIDLEWYQASE